MGNVPEPGSCIATAYLLRSPEGKYGCCIVVSDNGHTSFNIECAYETLGALAEEARRIIIGELRKRPQPVEREPFTPGEWR